MDTFGNAVLSYAFENPNDLENPIISYGSFDKAGRQLSQIDSLGRKTSFEYDGHNQLAKQTLPDGAETQFFYNAAGSLKERRMPEGLSWHAEFDALGRVHREYNKGADAKLTREFNYSFYDEEFSQRRSYDDEFARGSYRTPRDFYDPQVSFIPAIMMNGHVLTTELRRIRPWLGSMHIDFEYEPVRSLIQSVTR